MPATDASFSWPDVLGPLSRREDLEPAQAEAAMAAILGGTATDAQIAAFAVLLRAKGETPVELAALVWTMLRFAEAIPIDPEGAAGPLVDTCGTGGDRSHTFNISTVAAIVIAGAGVRVAKHGNRAASSACGSADLLEELGVAIDLGPDGIVRCIDEANIGFCFAQRFHAAMRYVGPARKELGIATTFNFLGPLANPARVTRQVVGVSDPAMADRVVGTLGELGARHAMVFFGHDGLDELTTTDLSTVRELRDGEVHRSILDPLDLGIARAGAADLRGGSPAHNASIARRVLDGEKGAMRDVVLLNAAAALVVADAAPDFASGFDAASAAIDTGRAAETLATFIAVSQSARGAEAG
ncbi:MAG: anthranilate phosphoribosyltransferase [Acidimicrobiia bacterium]